MRGEIKNKEYATRIKDFTGLRFDNCTPTDIDGLLEFSDRLFVFLEGKYGEATLSDGQRIALERTCDAIASTGRIAIVLVVQHWTSPGEKIDYANCPVTTMRWHSAWHKFPEPISCRQIIEKFIRIAGIRFSQPWVLGGPGYR